MLTVEIDERLTLLAVHRNTVPEWRSGNLSERRVRPSQRPLSKELCALNLITPVRQAAKS